VIINYELEILIKLQKNDCRSPGAKFSKTVSKISPIMNVTFKCEGKTVLKLKPCSTNTNMEHLSGTLIN